MLGHDGARWHVVHRAARAGRVLLVLGADAVADHHAALMRHDAVPIALTHRAGRIGRRNPFLGEAQHVGCDVPGVCCHGLQVVAFRAQPGVSAIRFRRNGRDQELPVDPRSGRFLLVDWTDPAPISAFTGLVTGRGMVVPAAPDLPFSPAHAAAMRAADQTAAAAA